MVRDMSLPTSHPESVTLRSGASLRGPSRHLLMVLTIGVGLILGWFSVHLVRSQQALEGMLQTLRCGQGEGPNHPLCKPLSLELQRHGYQQVALLLLLSLLMLGVSVLIVHTWLRSLRSRLDQVRHLAHRLAGDGPDVASQQDHQDELEPLTLALGNAAKERNTHLADLAAGVSALADCNQVLDQLSTTVDDVRKRDSKGKDGQRLLQSSVVRLIEGVEQAQVHTATTLEQAESGVSAVESVHQIISDVYVTVQKASGTIDQLQRRSAGIEGIVNLIQEIADQTRLIALNAAIEAARAGDHGRGFAVVAEEVRRLAEQAQRSTREVRKLIGSLQHESLEAVRHMISADASVEQSVSRSKQAAEALRVINSSAEQSAGIIDNIAEITHELLSRGGMNHHAEPGAELIENDSASLLQEEQKVLIALQEQLGNLRSRFGKYAADGRSPATGIGD